MNGRHTQSLERKFYYENGNFKRISFKLIKNSDEYIEAFKKTNSSKISFKDVSYYKNGKVFYEKIHLSDDKDDNYWFESTYNDKGEITSKGWLKNGIKNGEWEFLNMEKKYFFPVVVDVIPGRDISDMMFHQNERIAFALSDDFVDLTPLINNSVVTWRSVYGDDTDRGYPFRDGEHIINLKSAFTPDKTKADLVKKVFSLESEYKIEIDLYSKITKIERL